LGFPLKARAADHRSGHSSKMGMSRGARKIADDPDQATPSWPAIPFIAVAQLDIERGDAAGVVGRQHHFHRLVNIAPFRVMIALFSHQRGSAP